MNEACLVGRTTAKPELRVTSNGNKVCRFTLAVSRNFKNQNGEYETDFINCIVFNLRAETVNEYVEKGDLIGIVGRIQTGSYTNNQGQRIYTTDIVAESVQFLSNKRNNQTEQEQVIDQDPFSEFGEQVSIDDNFLD